MDDRETIKQLVREALEKRGVGSQAQDKVPAPPHRGVITADDVAAIEPGRELIVSSGTLVTPLARELAASRNVRLLSEDQQPTQSIRVAIGADHGGYIMKEHLREFLQRQGYAVQDLGTYDERPVDYPDVAEAVALAVANGRADRGIVVDSVGIGSCMAANKVPGVLAAMCYDETTARNARQHNCANVLALGGKLLAPQQAERIVGVWLQTAEGEERHQRRANKIRAMERRYSGTGF